MESETRLEGDSADLRRRAEDLSKQIETPPLEYMLPVDTRRLLHELRVHQMELELQNEELQRVQAELEAARARYFDLYNLAPVGYVTLSDKGLILEANLTAAKMFGVPRGALSKLRLTSFVRSDDQDIFYRQRKRVVETGDRHTSEMRIVRADGAEFWARVEVAAGSAEGTAVFRVVMSDISEDKRSEARLLQAEKMEAVGVLAGGLAHDFNNLLTVINGYSYMALQDLASSDPLRRSMEEIQKAGGRAAELTQRLLAFGRKQVLRPKLIDLNRVVTEMRPLLDGLVGMNVRVSVKLNPDAGMVNADAHQLEQVLINLVMNARDAMPDGGRLLIETDLVERDASQEMPGADLGRGRNFMLAVSDNGVGMNEATRLRVFEPFFTTKALGKGTGLGLASVYGIVSQSGGQVEVSSEPGQGATFRIYLPSSVEAAAPVIAGTPVAVSGLNGTETVLVVEDQASIRDFVAGALETYGYRVIQAEDASEALMLFDENQKEIDLVLTDVVMPNMNGRQFADQLERSWPGTRVLFMSGYSSEIMVQEGILKPTFEMIQKPFSAPELARKVRSVLGPAAADASPGR